MAIMISQQVDVPPSSAKSPLSAAPASVTATSDALVIRTQTSSKRKLNPKFDKAKSTLRTLLKSHRHRSKNANPPTTQSHAPIPTLTTLPPELRRLILAYLLPNTPCATWKAWDLHTLRHDGHRPELSILRASRALYHDGAALMFPFYDLQVSLFPGPQDVGSGLLMGQYVSRRGALPGGMRWLRRLCVRLDYVEFGLERIRTAYEGTRRLLAISVCKDAGAALPQLGEVEVVFGFGFRFMDVFRGHTMEHSRFFRGVLEGEKVQIGTKGSRRRLLRKVIAKKLVKRSEEFRLEKVLYKADYEDTDGWGTAGMWGIRAGLGPWDEEEKAAVLKEWGRVLDLWLRPWMSEEGDVGESETGVEK